MRVAQLAEETDFTIEGDARIDTSSFVASLNEMLSSGAMTAD
jgi:hypothetical protein